MKQKRGMFDSTPQIKPHKTPLSQTHTIYHQKKESLKYGIGQSYRPYKYAISPT